MAAPLVPTRPIAVLQEWEGVFPRRWKLKGMKGLLYFNSKSTINLPTWISSPLHRCGEDQTITSYPHHSPKSVLADQGFAARKRGFQCHFSSIGTTAAIIVGIFDPQIFGGENHLAQVSADDWGPPLGCICGTAGFPVSVSDRCPQTPGG